MTAENIIIGTIADKTLFICFDNSFSIGVQEKNIAVDFTNDNNYIYTTTALKNAVDLLDSLLVDGYSDLYNIPEFRVYDKAMNMFRPEIGKPPKTKEQFIEYWYNMIFSTNDFYPVLRKTFKLTDGQFEILVDIIQEPIKRYILKQINNSLMRIK